ncbi:MAG: hypothetical protein QOE96_2236, partial [Blastocatellia bacterium]|nr:hypothetical protein [Blastocatellia bacterium]
MSDKLQFAARFHDGRRLNKQVKQNFAAPRRRWRTRLRIAIVSLALALISLSAFLIHSYRSYAKIVDG